MKLWIGWLLALSVAFVPSLLAAQKPEDKKPEDKKPEEKKDDKPAAPDKESAAYYPLKKDTTWTYKAQDKSFTVKVGAEEKVGDENCTRLEYLTKAGDKETAIATEYVVVKQDGAYRCAFSGAKADKPYCFLKFPIKDGEEWEAKSTIGGQKIEGKFKLTLEKSPFKVGDKTFDKVAKVEGTGLKVDQNEVLVTYWFAPNVGMVKQTVTVAGVKVEVDLEKFEEKK